MRALAASLLQLKDSVASLLIHRLGLQFASCTYARSHRQAKLQHIGTEANADMMTSIYEQSLKSWHASMGTILNEVNEQFDTKVKVDNSHAVH